MYKRQVRNSLHLVAQAEEWFSPSRIRQIKKGLKNGAKVREAHTAKEIRDFAHMLHKEMCIRDSVWTIRHLATCYRQIRNFNSALEYYKKAESIQPDNRNILFYIGNCLAELERYEEALQYFFKLDLMENNCVKAWRRWV